MWQGVRRIDLIENIADVIVIDDWRGEQNADVRIVVDDRVAMEGQLQAWKGIAGYGTAQRVALEVD